MLDGLTLRIAGSVPAATSAPASTNSACTLDDIQRAKAAFDAIPKPDFDHMVCDEEGWQQLKAECIKETRVASGFGGIIHGRCEVEANRFCGLPVWIEPTEILACKRAAKLMEQNKSVRLVLGKKTFQAREGAGP